MLEIIHILYLVLSASAQNHKPMSGQPGFSAFLVHSGSKRELHCEVMNFYITKISQEIPYVIVKVCPRFQQGGKLIPLACDVTTFPSFLSRELIFGLFVTS